MDTNNSIAVTKVGGEDNTPSPSLLTPQVRCERGADRNDKPTELLQVPQDNISRFVPNVQENIQLQASNDYSPNQINNLVHTTEDTDTTGENETNVSAIFCTLYSADGEIDTETRKRYKECYQLLMNRI